MTDLPSSPEPEPIDPDLLRFVQSLAIADARRDHAAELAARRAPPPPEAVEVAAEPVPERR